MIKSLLRPLAAVVMAASFAAIPAIVSAEGLESEIELLRSDIKAEKVQIVTEALKLEGAKADAFWPVYRKYQLDLDKISDKRLALIKDFGANMDSMTDAKAKSLVNQSLDLQSQRNALLKKYYKDFDKVLGSTEAAKLIQVEHLIMALVDVQVGANMPLIEKPVANH